MKKAKISIICALAKDRAIGYQNKLLWHIPADMRRFKKLTTGHPVIMGLKTFRSIGKALPNRINIVLCQGIEKLPKNCIMGSSLKEALKKAAATGTDEVFIIGGGSVYEQTINLADKLYLTIVDGKYKADTYFPGYSAFKKVVYQKKGKSGGYQYQFIELERQ